MKSRVNNKILFFSLLLTALVAGCGIIEGLFNPFAGTWQSGAFELEFKPDKTFNLAVGKTVSVNLDGTYSYDDSKLTLNLGDSGNVGFAYRFNDDKTRLTLTPETEFEYIRTKLEFTKQ